MKKLAAAVLLLWLLCSAAGCSTGSGVSDEVDVTKLPSKVDLRDYDGKNYVTPVKCQMFGDCWTFALAGSAEIAYLYANDMGVPAGEVNDKVNYSEKCISWYMFHGITEDDVIKGKVRTSQIGEGFDPSEAESAFPNAVIGGPYVHQASFFASGFGPVDESVAVNGEYPYAYNNDTELEWALPLNAEYRNAPVDAVFRSSCMLPSPAGADADGAYALNIEGLNAIKSELYQGHGVSLAFNSAEAGFSVKHRSAYYSGENPPDHAVTAVGYDDDYPKENFTRTYTDGKEIEGTTPPGDGAFIIKNSWGLVGDNSADDGYFYLSYYDHSIDSPMSLVFDNMQSVTHTAMNYDQYDLMMTVWYGCTEYADETKMANIFDAEEDESLYQIAYRTESPDTEVIYEVYKDIDEDNPSSGTLLEKGENSHRYAGCYRIDLRSEFELKKGERYSVVLTVKRKSDDDGGTVYTEIFPYSTEFSDGLSVRGVINQGESYLYTDGKWIDMANRKESLIERAFRLGNEEIEVDEKSPKISLDSKETFTVDNYSIKAILAPADH